MSPPILSFSLLFFLIYLFPCTGNSSASSRYSFSLTTFDPSGKLGQVDRAVEAAALGPPLVALALENQVLLAAPQSLPSPCLTLDDGTPRMVRITPELIVAHTGLSADGRILCAEAHNVALQHYYTYNQDISLATFLQSMSLHMQEYTMKPGRRPFGCTLVVAFVPRNSATQRPQLFRLDPSGSVHKLENVAVINGKGEDTGLLQSRLATAAANDDDDNLAILSTWFHEQLSIQAKKQQLESVPETILVARAISNGQFRQERHSRPEHLQT